MSRSQSLYTDCVFWLAFFITKKEIENLEIEKEELKRENEELKDYVRLAVGKGIKFVKEVI